jgi:hypothetical protein
VGEGLDISTVPWIAKLTFLSIKQRFLSQMAQAFPVHTPVRFAVDPWITTVIQNRLLIDSFEGDLKGNVCLPTGGDTPTPPSNHHHTERTVMIVRCWYQMAHRYRTEISQPKTEISQYKTEISQMAHRSSSGIRRRRSARSQSTYTTDISQSKLTFLSLELTCLSLKLTCLSLKLTCLSLKLTCLSLKLTCFSLKLTLLSLKLIFLSPV